MEHYRLPYPVATIHGEELLPVDTPLTTDNLRRILDSNGRRFESLPIFEFDSIRDDVLSAFGKSPYNVIFYDDEHTRDVLNLMNRVSLPLPVLETLNYFKKRDFYTYRHFLMVFALSTLVARDIVPDHQELSRDILASATHDIGKFNIPLDVLNKSTPLTHKEMDLLKHHTVAGYLLLTYYFNDLESVSARVARDHHERRDGAGYPFGAPVRDRLIDLIVVCDIYDALISPRPYRTTSFENRAAIEEITWMAFNGELNQAAVRSLVRHNRIGRPEFEACVVSLEKRGVPPENNLYGVFVDERKNQAQSEQTLQSADPDAKRL